MAVSRIDSISKPQALKNAILEALQGGVYKAGDRLPSEPELITQYGVSRATVREALISLEQEGWIIRLHGKGTYVQDRPKVHRTLAVIAPYLYASETPHFRAGGDVMPLLMQSIESHARKEGISIMLYLDNKQIDTERDNMTDVLDRKVDAILMFYIGGQRNLDCLEKIQAANVPLVLFDRYVEELPIPSVATDNHQGSYGATMRFLDAGFPAVTYVTGPIDSTVLRDRRQGYLDAMASQGVPPDVMELQQTLHETNGMLNYELASELVDRMKFPRAIFTADATRLAILTHLLQERNVPLADYALGCFDEPYLNLPDETLLIKVLQPLQEIGRKAVSLAVERMEGRSSDGDSPSLILLAPELYVSGASALSGTSPTS